jgi:asparagine synthase (glutamine-hydrolysing)
MINLDGSPIDRQLLDRMTRFMAFRGPDALVTWVDGAVGFGHTLLRTTVESERERQPSSLDGQVWITADARIDDRANLINKLVGQGREATLEVPDAELILLAYHAWGERCVDHLLGDFAFAIWDGRERRLFCARDHLGVKPFFYAVVRGCLIFSNTLSCVRLHPAVSDRLNDQTIADFLVFDYNQDVSTTAFADVLRLAPAHTLTWPAGMSVHLHRYWDLPVDGDIRYRRQEEYAQHLRDLLRQAVGDRLRARRVAVLMSGGMDSPAVAAVARRLVPAGPEPLELQAFTVVFDSLIPDQERFYAGQAAEMLDIPIHFLSADGYRLYQGWDRPEMQTPEPCNWPCRQSEQDLLRRVMGHSRILLTGYGADPLMHASPTYALSLLKSGAWARLASELGRTLARGYLPKIGLRARLRRWLGRGDPPASLPAWVHPDLAARLDLAGRCHEVNRGRTAKHERRPNAWLDLTSCFWPWAFEESDPGVTGFPVENRHPFFDLRVVSWFLAIPALPWCDQKEVLRWAMADLLPEPLRRRPKARCLAQALLAVPIPLFVPRRRPEQGSPGQDPQDPLPQFLRLEESAWVDQFEAAPELAEYVVRERVPRLFGETDSTVVCTNLRPLSLNYWLARRNDFTAPARVSPEEQAVRSACPAPASVPHA